MNTESFAATALAYSNDTVLIVKKDDPEVVNLKTERVKSFIFESDNKCIPQD